MSLKEIAKIIEGVLFVSGEGVAIDEFKTRFEMNDREFNKCIDILKEKYNQDSGINIITYKNKVQLCSNPEIVLIHDGARPFISKEIIKKAIDLTYEKKAVVVGVSAIDTIKEIKDGKIIKTLDRRNIFQAQTPQAFEYSLIKKIHEEYKNNQNFTDDSSMAENYGIEVFALEGSKTNKKITTKEDLA